ncbi:MAG: hypothetical protein J2P46_03455 [Zavarzinella sp.]|nr:hypothetical protein [Zavarzinella sp.]
MKLSPRLRDTLLAFALLTPVAVVVFVWAACSPPGDKVNVRIVGLPGDLPFYCLAAWTADGPQPLEWYNPYWGEWSAHRPDGRGWRKGIESSGDVPARWRRADRYGVLTYSATTGWRVYRFRADEVPVEGGGIVTSRYVTFELTGRPAEPLDEATVDQLGLSAVPGELTDTPPRRGP